MSPKSASVAIGEPENSPTLAPVSRRKMTVLPCSPFNQHKFARNSHLSNSNLDFEYAGHFDSSLVSREMSKLTGQHSRKLVLIVH